MPSTLAASPTATALLDILQQVFGYPAFRGQQAAVVGHVCGGGDALVLMPMLTTPSSTTPPPPVPTGRSA